MKRRPRPDIKFNALLPVLTIGELYHRRITAATYQTLPEGERSEYRSGSGRTYYYYRIVRAEDYPNPAVDKLRRTLKRQRVAFTEVVETDAGREFIRFSTVGADFV